MTDVSDRLAALSPDKRALFEQLARARRIEHTFPLSVFQEGMWFLEQLHPHNPAYVGISAVRMEGHAVDVGLLAAALNDVARRNEAARTTFQLRDGRPAQVVAPVVDYDVPQIDLRDQALDEAQLQRLAVAAVLDEPFDIATEPPVRMALLRLTDHESMLVAAAHHLVFDRQAFGLLLAEMSTVYDALAEGRPSPLPSPSVQYGDFAAWQRDQRDQGSWEPHLAYWREELAGAPAALELPLDRPRPAVQGFRGAQLPIEIPARLLDRLAALAHARSATTYMALLAAYAVLLHRYSGQDDIVVGVPASIRDRLETESLLGYFINTLPVRVRLHDNPTFAEVLDRVRSSALGAYEHQEVPFDVVVADLQVPRDLSRSPIYQASFTYGREPVPQKGFGDVRLTRVPLPSEGARFDLELQAFHREGALRGWFEYDRDLFDPSTVAAFAGQLQRLVEEVVADPDRRVDLIDVLDAEQRRWIVTEVNDTAREWPEDDGWIHQCIERQTRRTPDAPAVIFEGAVVNYARLNGRSNQLARRLVRAGVGRDTLVGVAMHRCVDLVVSLLAVVKAGGAYVPLDPEYPRRRLEHMIEDSRAPVVLTHRDLLPNLPPLQAQVLCLDEIGDELDQEADHDLDLPVAGEDLAYVIYTSGSTGRPKGVMNIHSAIRNRLLWMQEEFGLGGDDRVLQKTPFSFDVSVWEFFWPLMVGASLVVARPGGHRDPAYLSEVIRQEAVTTLHFVPSMLQAFLGERVGECSALRRVLCSGEALPRDLQDRFLACSDAELHNLYGPTEAAIDVTHWQCRADLPPGPVPIGHPIANTQVYVLDRYLQPVPTGVAGELCLGGDNLARGYLDRPELTAERFVANPLDGTPGARLYRTGDLARLRPDGAVQFLGRLDHQVKLRGFRIELGEIEAVAASLPGVREVVVVDRELRPGDVRLVAYLTVDGEPAPEPGDLAAALREQLPEHMIPTYFEVLSVLPLSSNGKVDRSALPMPAQAGRPSVVAFTPPADAMEDTVAAIWMEVLGLDRVGRHDNFFDLGGHSLLLAQAQAELTRRSGRQVPMVSLFQYPTVATLAEHLSGIGGREGEQAARDGTTERVETRRQARERRRRRAQRRADSVSAR